MKKLIILFALAVFEFSWAQQSNYISNFHDTKGNINVNSTGQLQYVLPIDLPKGIKNVSPNIALTYSSNSGNGIAGYGWSISGITAITRSGKTIEKDNELEKIKLGNSDYFSFNGQRLILKSGVYGYDGAEYVTEKYSNIKIRSLGSISTSIPGWEGPLGFEVTFEDGSQAWYGTNSVNDWKSRTPLEYNITKWKDSQGNVIIYDYEQENNVSFINSIKWGGNETLNKPNINEISFIYTIRDIREQSFIEDVEFIQKKLLSSVIVKSQNSQFKKYNINYFKNGSNYQFVDSITEYNSNNEPANPVTFTYPNFNSSSLEYGILPNNAESFDNVKFTGDFNGDSYLDFLMINGALKLGAFDDNFVNINTNKIFSSKAKVVQTLIDTDGQVYNGNGIVDYEDGYLRGYVLKNNVFVKVFEKFIYQKECSPLALICNVNLSLDTGDINGDGIEDVFLKMSLSEWFSGGGIDPPNTLIPANSIPVSTPIGNFIVDLKDPNLPLSVFDIDASVTNLNAGNEKYLDVNGDGKVDIINVSNSAYTVFEFTEVGTNQYLKKVKFSSSLIETKDNDYPVLYGDFNGDGNLDFAIPTTNTLNEDHWRFYIGTGNGFHNVLKTNFLKYRNPGQDTGWSNINRHFYSISDINKDGKSDIVHIYTENTVRYVGSDGNATVRNLKYEVRTMLANGETDFISGFSAASPTYTLIGEEHTLFAPLTAPIKSNNNYYNIFLYYKNKYIYKYKSQSSLAELSRIISINQAGVQTSISYEELIPAVNNFYKKNRSEIYPYFSLQRSDQSYAVSQLIQGLIKQDFRYRGMTGHLQGRGMVGFYQTARSSWYSSGYENTKIWSGTEIDTQNYGLPTKEWAIRTNDENLIFPNNISLNNNQLLSLKLTEYSFQQLSNGVDVILPQQITEKDFSKNITSVSNITYGEYYLPVLTKIDINQPFALKTTEMHYTHNASGIGESYFIGRPEWKEEITAAYNDTAKSKEVYTYNNNLLQSLIKYDKNNTGWIKENYEYDGVGNLTKKIISNSADSQTATEENFYDTTARFIIGTKDNLGLEAHFTYNSKGQILTQSDPFGNTLSNTYDHWGKPLSSTSSLTGTTTYSYDKFNSGNVLGTKVVSTQPDNTVSVVFTNTLGQNYKSLTKSFNQGKYTVKEKAFDPLGRTIAESEPYESVSITSNPGSVNPVTWNTVSYDDSFFPAKVTSTAFNNGKSIQTLSAGNTITVTELNGYGRTTSKTTDPLGNVISSTDKGGTINFIYNASGQNTRAIYQSNVVSTTYNEWGRKSEFHDPSNGLYRYHYDGLGKIIRITSPKGFKEFTYSANGLLQNVSENSDDGTSTIKDISLDYNDKGQLLLKKGESNGRTYEHIYEYYADGRIKNETEKFEEKEFFTGNIVYDNSGRVLQYRKRIISDAFETSVTILNEYSLWNGELSSVKDAESGKTLWSLNSTNAKGQVLNAALGKSNIYNTYNAFGFLTNTDHQYQSQTPGQNSILNISYSFDAVKNELNARTTTGSLNISEAFVYDDNNRLLEWTNPATGQMSYNEYDDEGRIIRNEQLGEIGYNDNISIYRPTSIDLNAQGQQHYQINGTSKLLQMISYNENNDPLRIDGTRYDYNFEYGLTSSRQIMYYGVNFDDAKDAVLTKFYSENGDFEIIRNNENNTEKHIIYIGGSPYESSIVYIKEEAGENYYFLHKDYLGSILAITDTEGKVIEQRHFDAWGMLTHLVVNGNVLDGNDALTEYFTAHNGLFLDRGYTSHEHLTGVELIHMNGRLYDPVLHRFLNADENIQDPHNTQNYNKYGYVMNNPLMFNDPNGEFIFAIFAALPVFWGTVATAAVIGATIGATMYSIQAAITGNFSVGGFAKSIFMGAVTGAVSGGLGQVFSVSGFWATVGNGALTGAGSGGITSLINGTSFLEGLWKGAVIGAAVAGVSYTISYFTQKNVIRGIQSTDNNELPYDPTISNHEMSCNINEAENKFFDTSERYGTGQHKLGKMLDNGYLDVGNPDYKFLAYTENRPNFWSGKYDVMYSARIAQNKRYLDYAMRHETGHAYSQLLKLPNFQLSKTINGWDDSIEHLAINFLEHDTANLSGLIYRSDIYFHSRYILERTLNTLDNHQLNIFNLIYTKLQPIFNKPIK